MIHVNGINRLETVNKKLFSENAFLSKRTGLFDENYFRCHVKKECNRCFRQRTGLSIMMISIDFFETIQNIYQPVVRDKCLQEFIKSVQTVLRNYDTLCYFFDGKFAVLCPGANINQASLVAERIRSKIEKITIQVEENIKIPLTASIGVSSMLTTEKKLSNIIERAEKALDNAQNMGKNRVCKY